MPEKSPVTRTILQCASEGRSVQLNADTEPLLPLLIEAQYVSVDTVGGQFYPEMTRTGDFIHLRLLPKGKDLLDTFR